MKEDAIFALKISGIELADIKPSDLALLMQHFCKMQNKLGLLLNQIGSDYLIQP